MFVMLCASINAFAQNIEQIYMKNGSVVEGYIAEQKPGKSITIQTTSATIVVNSDSLQNKIIERVPVESLSKEWRIWAETNNKLIDNNGKKQLELVTLEFKNSIYSKVYIIEKGSLIKFIDVSPNQYTFKWGDMYRTVKNKRPDNLFSGLKEVLVLKDGTEIEGQITEQFPGKDLKITTEKGEILSFKFTQIKKIITKKLNDRFDLWSQIQLLDKIQLKKDNSFLEGFISSRTLSKELVIEFEDGSNRIISMNDILSYSKIPNTKYIAAYDKALKEGEILLNGKAAYFAKLEVNNQFLILGDIVSAQLPVGESVVIEANLVNNDSSIVLVKAHDESITKQIGKKNVTLLAPVITYQDLFQSNLPFKREETPLGNIRIFFKLEEEGDYVLYIQGIEGYIIINVINKQQ